MNPIQSTPISTPKTSDHSAQAVKKAATVGDSEQVSTIKAAHAAQKGAAPASTGIELSKPAVEASVDNAGQIIKSLQSYATQTSPESTAVAAQILSSLFPASLLEAIQRDGSHISPETEAALMQFLSEFDVDQLIATLNKAGIVVSQEDADQIRQLLSKAEAPGPDYLFGVPANVNASIDLLCSLMNMIFELIQAAIKVKSDSAQRGFKATLAAADEQRSQGNSAFQGAIVSGVASTVVSIGGAYKSINGSGQKIEATKEQGYLNDPNDISNLSQAQIHDLTQTGESNYQWGRVMQDHGSQFLGGTVKGGFEMAGASHNANSTVQNAASAVDHGIADQQGQEVSTSYASLAKLLDTLKEFRNSQQSTIGTIASNTRPA